MTDTFSPSPAVPAYPQARTCPYRLPSGYDHLRDDEAPLTRVRLYDGRTAWVVTHHETARTLLADPRLSSDRLRDGFPVISPRFLALTRRNIRPGLIGMDRPEHGAQRRLLIADFTVRRIKSMRGDIERIVAGFLDEMLAAGPPADLVTAFALPVPSMVICKLLGVPYEDHAFFQGASRRLLQSETADGTAAARDDLADYLRDLIAERERSPGPGLLGRLVMGLASGEGPDREDLVSLAILLLVAGHETTASMISLSVITLLEHPDQFAALRADPEVMPEAVEELLRYLSIADLAGVRMATGDIEVGGITIRAGEGVIVSNAITNRDGAAFEAPDVFDVHRSARHHLAFGYGVHQCLGQNLARMELQIALTALFDRVPTLRLAVPADTLTLRPASTIQGINELPVTW
ncbi:cytochrome P450 [Actinomadura xylanilytica]|uniref:cytochrome P450 n=1 Tax=Actinomadura xylanilytica TaxID=887459 RepID=UPI00255B3327|nr:cytochrome P450 [Actinomadura xylanilytica]MDL4775361.1 cytochrome P450 [Actinomadura xylanilytica]